MAFLGCTSLKSVKLSTGVAKIDKNAFGSCSALQEIQVAKDNPNFSSLNGVLYSKKQDTLVKSIQPQRQMLHILFQAVLHLLQCMLFPRILIWRPLQFRIP